MAPKLDQLVEKYDKVILRKVDLSSRSGPIMEQSRSEFGVTGIPHVNVYGSGGELLGTARGIEAIEALVKKGL